MARDRCGLRGAAISHLQRLTRSWGLLADLSGNDLLLWAPESEGDGYIVLAHVRPTTGQTVHPDDPVGLVEAVGALPTIAAAVDQDGIVDGRRPPIGGGDEIELSAIPVRRHGLVLAVLTSEGLAAHSGAMSELETTYRSVFGRFAVMIDQGQFPFPHDEGDQPRAPRVGDGAVLLDADGRVVYNSPNAVSALHRLGVHTNAEGRRLTDIGLEPQTVRRAFDEHRPALVELDRGRDTTVLVQCFPLVDDDAVTGAFVLLRDVSELRRRDRLLLSKEATIREIHHRVKNNLQTISSLLRLQARRLRSEEAVDALEESVRRIAAIALVHETLAQDADGDDDEVLFLDIVRPLLRTVEEGLVSPEMPIEFRIVGDCGRLRGELAMPLAVVLTELLQNAVDHAFPAGLRSDGERCRVRIELEGTPDMVRVRVVDNGVGVGSEFSLDRPGLGMSIVQSFVCGDLQGTIDVADGPGSPPRVGTCVFLEVPRSRVAATVAGS